MFQTFGTTPGVQYQVSFEVGSDKYYDTYYTGTFSAPVVTASLNGGVVFSATNNFPGLTNYWQTWSFAFTANTTNTTLMFTGATSNRVAYIGLDNVMVTGPPPSLVTTIDRTNRNAYGANFGWTDWVADLPTMARSSGIMFARVMFTPPMSAGSISAAATPPTESATRTWPRTISASIRMAWAT